MFPLLTVRENLSMGAYLRRDPAGVKKDLFTFTSAFRGLGSGWTRRLARYRVASNRCWRSPAH